MTNVEIIYLGKPAKFDPKTKKVIEHHKEYTIGTCSNWKEVYVKEFKGILDKYDGIKEIRFFI